MKVRSHEGVMVGDLHLEKAALFLPSHWDHLKPTFDALDRVVEYMRTHGLTHMILPGDIFDDPFPRQRTVVALIRWFKKNPWIRFDVILGNHDYSSTEENALQMAEFVAQAGMLKHVNLHVKGVDIVKFNGVPFCFMPHPNTVAPKTEYAKINVAHFELTGAKRDNGQVIKDSHVLPKSKDYWMLGHLHTFQQFSNATFVGTLDQKNYGEPLPKGFLHFKFKVRKTGDLQVSTKFVEVDPPYKLITIKVASVEDLKQITDDPAHFYRLLVKKGVMVPDAIIHHPQVMKHEGWKNKQELSALEQSKLEVIDEEIQTFDPTHGLKARLIKVEGLSKKDAKRGTEIVKALIDRNPELREVA